MINIEFLTLESKAWMLIFVRQNKSRESNAKLAEVNKKEQEQNKKIAEFLILIPRIYQK